MKINSNPTEYTAILQAMQAQVQHLLAELDQYASEAENPNSPNARLIVSQIKQKVDEIYRPYFEMLKDLDLFYAYF